MLCVCRIFEMGIGSCSSCVVLMTLEIVRGRLYPAFPRGTERPCTTCSQSVNATFDLSSGMTYNAANDQEPNHDLDGFYDLSYVFWDLTVDFDLA